MKTRWIVSAGTLLASAWTLVLALPLVAGDCPNCKQGNCYQEVVTYRCKMVPDNKPIKKTVYECKEVPYCEHKLSKFGHCDCCPECQACPKFKKVLIKREIVTGEKCGTKCVPEAVVARVCVPCCRCGHHPGAATTTPPVPVVVVE